MRETTLGRAGIMACPFVRFLPLLFPTFWAHADNSGALEAGVAGDGREEFIPNPVKAVYYFTSLTSSEEGSEKLPIG